MTAADVAAPAPTRRDWLALTVLSIGLGRVSSLI